MRFVQPLTPDTLRPDRDAADVKVQAQRRQRSADELQHFAEAEARTAREAASVPHLRWVGREPGGAAAVTRAGG